jgi:hypothetical protein
MIRGMRFASWSLLLLAGCYRSHGRTDERRDAAAALDAPPATDAGSCGGETDVSISLVRSVGAAAFLELTHAEVVGFGECGTGSITFGLDFDPAAKSPLVEVSIPITDDAPIDRDGDWPCTLRTSLGMDETCSITGRIAGYAYTGFYVDLSIMLGGIGYSAGGQLRMPVCDVLICP